jgi:hypothetical protein
VLHWWFYFWNEIPINCLFTNWKCTYVFNFRPWRWSALNMGCVVKRPSRRQGQCFFSKLGEEGNNFRSGSKKSLEGCPNADLTPPKVCARVVIVCLFLLINFFCDFKVDMSNSITCLDHTPIFEFIDKFVSSILSRLSHFTIYIV